jgi:hypothetical protein
VDGAADRAADQTVQLVGRQGERRLLTFELDLGHAEVVDREDVTSREVAGGDNDRDGLPGGAPEDEPTNDRDCHEHDPDEHPGIDPAEPGDPSPACSRADCRHAGSPRALIVSAAAGADGIARDPRVGSKGVSNAVQCRKRTDPGGSARKHTEWPTLLVTVITRARLIRISVVGL